MAVSQDPCQTTLLNAGRDVELGLSCFEVGVRQICGLMANLNPEISQLQFRAPFRTNAAADCFRKAWLRTGAATLRGSLRAILKQCSFLLRCFGAGNGMSANFDLRFLNRAQSCGVRGLANDQLCGHHYS